MIEKKVTIETDSEAAEFSGKDRIQVEDIGTFPDNRFWFPDYSVKVPFKVRMA